MILSEWGCLPADHRKTVLQDQAGENEQHQAGQQASIVQGFEIVVVNPSGLRLCIPFEKISLVLSSSA